ncbi:NADH dehydrogenase [ubiquinone] 1 alpha subcomplex assembly factor 8 [Protopterus annectens]|uniref:NADH dehydrogenase [ubiquinone] 1 alpha subcomplex assembly factor 8 n=1 Tax=Protopterus annectens TaxID=7888 RepID=UPI001CF944A4|nr:NADH dehydrogenase [ubiquinone] 1 alpha subcomplex assembly factor 8 [Protopterus annectens]
MSNVTVWTRTREKLKRFPELLAGCTEEAAAYGKCVAAATTGNQDLKKDTCAREFHALKKCFGDAIWVIYPAYHGIGVSLEPVEALERLYLAKSEPMLCSKANQQEYRQDGQQTWNVMMKTTKRK